MKVRRDMILCYSEHYLLAARYIPTVFRFACRPEVTEFCEFVVDGDLTTEYCRTMVNMVRTGKNRSGSWERTTLTLCCTLRASSVPKPKLLKPAPFASLIADVDV